MYEFHDNVNVNVCAYVCVSCAFVVCVCVVQTLLFIIARVDLVSLATLDCNYLCGRDKLKLKWHEEIHTGPVLNCLLHKSH